jgi:hypothetical protein
MTWAADLSDEIADLFGEYVEPSIFDQASFAPVVSRNALPTERKCEHQGCAQRKVAGSFARYCIVHTLGRAAKRREEKRCSYPGCAAHKERGSGKRYCTEHRAQQGMRDNEWDARSKSRQRTRARIEGRCVRCLSSAASAGFATCDQCRARALRAYHERKTRSRGSEAA